MVLPTVVDLFLLDQLIFCMEKTKQRMSKKLVELREILTFNQSRVVVVETQVGALEN